MTELKLNCSLAQVELANPIMNASGTLYLNELNDKRNLALGAIIPKSITYKPQRGNIPPWIFKSEFYTMNSVGLAGEGLANFLEQSLPRFLEYHDAIIVSVAGRTAAEWVAMLRELNTWNSIKLIELNFSCPNQESGDCPALDAKTTAKLLDKIRLVTDKGLLVKLSPNAPDILAVARAAELAGADVLTVANTYLGMAVDINSQKNRFAKEYAGLSGKAIKALTLRLVHMISSRCTIPIIACGGISSSRDLIEYLLAGAQAVQVGSARMRNPQLIAELISGLKSYCSKQNISHYRELVGKLK